MYSALCLVAVVATLHSFSTAAGADPAGNPYERTCCDNGRNFALNKNQEACRLSDGYAANFKPHEDGCKAAFTRCCQSKRDACIVGMKAAMDGKCDGSADTGDAHVTEVCCRACSAGQQSKNKNSTNCKNSLSDATKDESIVSELCCNLHPTARVETMFADRMETDICEAGQEFDKSAAGCVAVATCKKCSFSETCIKGRDGYKCVVGGCGQGYEYNESTMECVDVDECSTHLNQCSEFKEVCINVAGSHRCECKPGFRVDEELKTCTDVDECKERTHNCTMLEECRNMIGGFYCDRKRCSVDEELDANGKCVTTCSPGLKMKGDVCVKVDTCKDAKPCKADQICLNVADSFECKSCPSGHRPNDELTECVDIDECKSVGGNPCRTSEVCVNLNGGYECKCADGYDRVADKCEKVEAKVQCRSDVDCGHHGVCDTFQECFCRSGYHMVGGKCVDMDECNAYRCGHGKCVNTDGSFTCECSAGYQLNADGDDCIDVDECSAKTATCTDGKICANTDGKYECHCQPGLYLDADNVTCVNSSTIDRCHYLNRYKPADYCHGLKSDNGTCRCPGGFELDRCGRVCEDIDECSGPAACSGSDVCVNILGGHKCFAFTCPTGYNVDKSHQYTCKKDCRSNRSACQLPEPVSVQYNYFAFPANYSATGGRFPFFTFVTGRLSTKKLTFTITNVTVDEIGRSVRPATADNFEIVKTADDHANLTLVEPLPGPQDVEIRVMLDLDVRGTARPFHEAIIRIAVSGYDGQNFR